MNQIIFLLGNRSLSNARKKKNAFFSASGSIKHSVMRHTDDHFGVNLVKVIKRGEEKMRHCIAAVFCTFFLQSNSPKPCISLDIIVTSL